MGVSFKEQLKALATKTAQKLSNKVEINGDYGDSSTTVGNARQLISNVGIIDKVPYNFRTSGGSVSIGNRENDKIVGGTIVWNQLVETAGNITVPYGHKYISKISDTYTLSISNVEEIAVDDTDNVFDLTRMFGSAIADYIYSLGQAGIAWFRNLFSKPYYAYNAGELMSVCTNAHITRGFNVWDGEKAIVIGGNEYYVNGTYGTLSLDGEEITVTTNKFTPAHKGIITASSPSATLCINLSWSGYRNGEYESYIEHVYPLSAIELRGIPKLDENNNIYYDGDTYAFDGVVTRYYASRAYQSGDESLENAITDGITTIYKLETPTIETANPFTDPQSVDDFGTEEYVDALATAQTNPRDVSVPVGHETFYQANLRDKLQNLPNNASADGLYLVRQNGNNQELVAYAPTHETWTFTLEDETVVTKEVVIWTSQQ